jgi:cytoskeletal protein RodZ
MKLRFQLVLVVTALAGVPLLPQFGSADAQAQTQSAPTQEQPDAKPQAEPPPSQSEPHPSSQKAEPTEQPTPQEEKPQAAAPQASPDQGGSNPKKTQKQSAAKKKRKRKKDASLVSKDKDKVVVRNGGAKDGSVQIAPALSKEQELHNRESTAELLATTGANLKSLAGRQLTAAQKSMVEQINAYVRQAKSASDSGDVVRAHTLAFKAHLLSDNLVNK